MVLPADDFVLGAGLRKGLRRQVRLILAGGHDVLLFLLLAPQALDVVQGRAPGDCDEPGAEVAGGVEVREVQESFLEALHDDVIHVGLPLEKASDTAADGLLVPFIYRPEGHLVSGHGERGELAVGLFEILFHCFFRVNVLQASSFRRSIPP